MSIQKIKCFIPVCDVCGKKADEDAEMIAHYDTEAEALERACENTDYGGSGCEMIDGKLCCSHCWTYDDDGEIVLRKTDSNVEPELTGTDNSTTE